MPSYLAFDLGASGSRAVLGTLQDGVMHMAEVHRFTTPILEQGPHLYWDLDVLWRELKQGLQQALAASPALCSLSVDAWGVDYVPLDAEGRPLRLPYCYRDPRTNGLMEDAFNTLSRDRIYAHTGIQFLPFNTLYQLLADQRDDPQGLAQVAQHLSMADYFNFRFSGQAAAEVSMASTTQMMDVHTRRWSGSVLHAFGLDPEQWPAIVPAGTLLGPVQQAPQVQAIATCSHDTGCAVAAVPADDAAGPWAYISCGTWSLIGVERRAPLLTDAARVAGFTHEAGLDGTLRFLKNLTGLWALQECARQWETTDWASLEQAARQAPRLSTRINLEDPRFAARGDMLQRLSAYCRENDLPVPASQGQWVRVILESIAEAYRKARNDLQRLTGQTYEVLHLVGGGSQNALLCELTAQACGMPVVAGPVEATALGNLLIQARTLGHLPPGKTLRQIAAVSCTLKRYG